MLCEFLQGGDLFSHIVNKGGILDHDATRFYVGGVTLVFQSVTTNKMNKI